MTYAPPEPIKPTRDVETSVRRIFEGAIAHIVIASIKEFLENDEAKERKKRRTTRVNRVDSENI